MYTKASKAYPDLLRAQNKVRLRSFNSQAISQLGTSEKNVEVKTRKGVAKAVDSDVELEEDEIYPPFVDPTEPEERCFDPICFLRIPRSEYREVKDLALCNKRITRLHKNVQFLENLDTLILCRNHIKEFSFLLPERRGVKTIAEPSSRSGASASSGDDVGVRNIDCGDITSSWCRPRGCHLLQRLFASHNLIRTLDGDIPRLRHLKVLLLAYNRLSNLAVVSTQLRRLRNLCELDLRGNPLCEEVGYRSFLIFEQPNVEILDRRRVEVGERNAAAKQFSVRAVDTFDEFDVGHVPTGVRSGRKSLVEHEKSEVAARNDAAPTANGDVRKKTQGSQNQKSLETEGKRRQSQNCGVARGAFPSTVGRNPRGSVRNSFRASEPSTPLLTEGILKNSTTQQLADSSARRTVRRASRPSLCEMLLEKKVRLLGKEKARRLELQEEAEKASRQEVVEAHKSFHFLWAMSGRGMPLCTEKFDPTLNTQDASNIGGAGESTPRAIAMRRKSVVAKQQPADAVGKGATKQTVLSIPSSPKRVKLPTLPSQMPGGTDHCIMYDALLVREEMKNKRVWNKPLCVPASPRLGQIRELISSTNKLLQLSGRTSQTDLCASFPPEHAHVLRDICMNKECLIPRPWEGSDEMPFTCTRDIFEYLSGVAMALLLPSEVSNIDNNFMINSAEVPQANDQQRGRRPQRKEKRVTHDVSRTQASSTSSFHTSVSGFLNLKLPMVLTSTVAELGPLEDNTIKRLTSLLDVNTGARDLCYRQLTEAFRNSYAPRCTEMQSPVQVEGEDRAQISAVEPRRSHRHNSRTRLRAERRLGSKCTTAHSESQVSTGFQGSSVSEKKPLLMLSQSLLDLVRYLPFVRSRLNYFTKECEEAVREGHDFKDLPMWFSRLQRASQHYEKLLQAIRCAGMSERDAEDHFVDFEGMMRVDVRKVGTCFSPV
uniref:Uncharacterized protein TCIL3000_3_870 n=1 Tax=Trypanosoma congolense (strain IL3000) TaxID=1068625 RepID=G0UJV8_TRYCI|nr:unnamed protein product [Trypanosoma congolense IL3000]